MSEEIRTGQTAHERPSRRAFLVVLIETALIFAVPAFLVLGVGVYLNISHAMLFILLGGAFVLSWIFVIYRIKKFSKS